MPDPRFDRLRTDPRFRRPKKKHSKVVVDDRFKGIFSQEKKRGRVDKYGRRVSKTHEEDNLRRFYHLDEGGSSIKPGPDYARGEALLESSDEGDEKIGNEIDSNESDDSSQPDDIITIGGEPKAKDVVDEEREVNLDEGDFADLDAQALAYNRAHPEEAEPSRQQEGQRTRRLAAVNLDWDHVRAVHLYRICSSLVSPTAPLVSTSKMANSNRVSESTHWVVRGQVLSVRIYPSQFGKGRIAREEKEGPPAEIFRKRKEDEEVDEKNIYDVADEVDYDEDALRKYQLERLRYYYAIITCDTAETAYHIYSELDGTELERSANVFDLSFVPDNMAFDEECRDEAMAVDLGANYKPLDFSTDALRHSKVNLTWDDDDPERNQITRRKLTRKDIEEADFRAYLASSSSGSESDGGGASLGAAKRSKKTVERERLRDLLLGGGGNDQMPEGWAKDKASDDVDMEITFMPGLSGVKGEGHQTTLEKYQQKMREKRKARKEVRKDRTALLEDDSKRVLGGDEFFAPSSDEGSHSEVVEEREGGKSKKGKNQNITPSRNTSRGKTPVSAGELALLVAADNPSLEPKHFNLKSVIKAEKRRGKKGKRKIGRDEEDELQEDFTINVFDERFKALHEDSQFAIDPSNPRFKKTKSMGALLEERHRRQQKRREEMESGSSKLATVPAEQGIHSLVESVKRKCANAQQRQGKRKRL